jgi:hypothetical protein
MNVHEIGLIVALALPALVLAVLRISASMVFLSLCLGAILVEYVAGEANSLITLFSAQAGSLSASSIQLFLLLAPAVVTCVVTLFSVRGGIKNLTNLLPAAASSAFAVLLVVPLLSPGLRFALEEQAIWSHLVRAQALIVGAGALISLAFLWFQRHHLRHPEKRKH